MPTEPLSPERLEELARRCEAADASEQRELLIEAWRAVNGTDVMPVSDPQAKKWLRFIAMIHAEAFESAALTLVPEGMDWAIDCAMGGVSAAVGFWPDAPSQSGATPALALTAATLRARAKEANDGNE